MCKLFLTIVPFLHTSYHTLQRVNRRNVLLLLRHLQICQKMPQNLTSFQRLVMPYLATGKSASQKQLTSFLAIPYISLQDPPHIWTLGHHTNVHDVSKIGMTLNFLKMIVRISLPAI